MCVALGVPWASSRFHRFPTNPEAALPPCGRAQSSPQPHTCAGRGHRTLLTGADDSHEVGTAMQ